MTHLFSTLRSLLVAAPLVLGLASPVLADPAAADCLAKATTTVEMQACAGAAHEKADAEINKTYQELLGKQNGRSKTLLKKAERAWIAFRDAHCAFATAGSAGGTIHAQSVAQCKTDLTVNRTAELRAAIDELNQR